MWRRLERCNTITYKRTSNENVGVVSSAQKYGTLLDAPVDKRSVYMEKLESVANKYGMSLDEYKQIVLRNIEDKNNLPSPEQVKTAKLIRDEILGELDKNIEFRKIIDQASLLEYLSGERNTVGGFIARNMDSGVLTEYNEMFNSMRLDYPGTTYLPEEDNFIAYIVFKVKNKEQLSKIEIPYSPLFEGTDVFDKNPCSGTGILNAKNGMIIPEFKGKYQQPIEFADGAEIHILSRNGCDTVIAEYSSRKKKFVRKEK